MMWNFRDIKGTLALLWKRKGVCALLSILFPWLVACRAEEEGIADTSGGSAHIAFALAIQPRDVTTRAGGET